MQDAFRLIFGSQDHISVAQESARAIAVFFYGLTMLRLSGRRTFASMSALDMVVSIIIGSMLSRAITGASPFAGTLVAVAILAALHVIMSYAIARSERFSKLVEGPCVRLATRGQIDEAVRLRHKISVSDIAEALRGHGFDGIAELDKIRKLELEPNGRISVVK